MNVVSLPARIAYALAAVPVGGAAGFYLSIWILPRLAMVFPQIDSDVDGYGMFKLALGVGAALAFTLSLLALTLPWKRHRQRGGRAWRIGASCVVVVVASTGLAADGYSLVYNLAFAVWLAYTLAFTFVRYGVVDQARRPSRTASSTY
jgi:uncharacterized membrane protein YfcA